MLTLSVVHHCNVGLGYVSKPGNFSRVIHTQLDHCNLMVVVQTQQGQRDADVVIEITFGRKHRLRPIDAKYRRDHLCDRGLAITACHGDEWQFELRSPTAGQ